MEINIFVIYQHTDGYLKTENRRNVDKEERSGSSPRALQHLDQVEQEKQLRNAKERQ